MESIKEGKHLFSGIDEVPVQKSFLGLPAEGYRLIIDNEVYCAYYDPDDGYRSYSSIYRDPDLKPSDIKFRFPPQEIYAINKNIDEIDEDDWPHIYNGIEFQNIEGETILEVGTDYSEDYYPHGHLAYYPENLPINKERNKTKNNEKKN